MYAQEELHNCQYNTNLLVITWHSLCHSLVMSLITHFHSHAVSWSPVHHTCCIVSELDPRNIGKLGLVNGIVWKCTLRNVILIAESCKACRVLCWTRPRTNVLSFSLGVYSFLTKQNVKTVSCGYISISHQNVNQKSIGSALVHQAQCTLPLLFDFVRVWFRDYLLHGSLLTWYWSVKPQWRSQDEQVTWA